MVWWLILIVTLMRWRMTWEVGLWAFLWEISRAVLLRWEDPLQWVAPRGTLKSIKWRNWAEHQNSSFCALWLAASSPCCHDFLAVLDCSLKLWTKINYFSEKERKERRRKERKREGRKEGRKKKMRAWHQESNGGRKLQRVRCVPRTLNSTQCFVIATCIL